MADILLSAITPGLSDESLEKIEQFLRRAVPHIDYDHLRLSDVQAALPPGTDIPPNVVSYLKQRLNRFPPDTPGMNGTTFPGIPGGGKKQKYRLQGYTVKELKAVAKKRNIKLTGLTRKADIIAKILSS
jgi:hypothetical protein